MAKIITQLPGSNGGSIHNNLQGLNEGDYIHLTASEKIVISNTSGINTGDQDLSGKADILDLNAHISNVGNPHLVTKAQVGLGNVDNTSDLNKPISTVTQSALDLKVDENVTIAGATKTKITYDSKGLVTNGVDATTADIAASSNKKYVTDAEKIIIENTSGINTGDQNLTGLVPYIGANTSVDLGVFDITAKALKAKSLDLNIASGDPGYAEGRMYYDNIRKTYTLYNDEPETALQLGEEQRIRVFNNNGVTILNGQAVTVVGLQPNGVIQVEKAIASNKTSALNTVGIATHDIEVGTYGWATTSGVIRGVNTSTYTEGAPLYLSDSIAGAYQETRPISPSYEVRMGGIIKSDVTNGEIYAELRIIDNDHDNNVFFNGSILEPTTVDIISNGTTVNCSLNSLAPNGRLSLIFNQDYVSVVNGINIDLTLGTDSIPVENWVYIDTSGTITKSLSGFPPATQYTPIARVVVPSAATAQIHGVYKTHAYTDHLAGSDKQGHVSHINSWIRKKDAIWVSGIALSQSVPEGTPSSTINLSYTSGVVSQLHDHNFPAYNTAIKPAFTINNFTSPYRIENGITNNINTDSTGVTIANNKYYNLVVWGVVSEETKDCKLFFNLPGGSYTNITDAVNDVDNTVNYSIPSTYTGTGFLITKFVVQRTSTNVIITPGNTKSLLGTIPSVGGGGTVGGGGITKYDELVDTPITKVGQSLKIVRVNAGETAHEYINPNASIINITPVGNISSTNVQSALQELDNEKQADLGFTPENLANKSDSYTVSSSATYASTKALVDGLGAKLSGSGTTNYIPKFTGSGTLGNSLFYDDGINIGLGTTTPLYPYDMRYNFTAGVSPAYMMHLKPIYTVPSTGSYEQSVFKIRSNMNIPAGVTQGGLYIGVYSSILRENALDAGNLVYLHSMASIYGHLPGVTGRTEYAHGVTVHPYHMGGSIGESRALYLENAYTGITPDKYWSVYQEDILAKNYFNANANLFGTLTDDGINIIQVNGNITASPATLSNQVVVKSQLDTKQNQLTAGTNITIDVTNPLNPVINASGGGSNNEELAYACSDETSNLTVGTLITFRMPFAMTLTSIRSSLNNAPTISSVIVDIKEGGVSIFSTLLSIDVNEKTSTTASMPAVISDVNLADDAEITVSTTQIGSGDTGKGLKILLKGTRV